MSEIITFDEVEALEFSADIDTPGKWQDKDGEWHEGMIPLEDIPFTKDETRIVGFTINGKEDKNATNRCR